MLFADGEAATLIPQIRDNVLANPKLNDPKSVDDFKKLEDRIVNQIRHDDPRFLGWFETEMHSGNPLRVDGALKRAASTQVAAIYNLDEVKAVREKIRADSSLKATLHDYVTHPEKAKSKSVVTVRAGANSKRSAPELRAQMDVTATADSSGDVAAVDQTLQSLFNPNSTTPDDALLGIFRLVSNVFAFGNFLIVYHAVGIVWSYAVGINIAAAVNYYQDVFAAKGVYTSGGGGTDASYWLDAGGIDLSYSTANTIAVTGAGGSLLYDQMVQSATDAFAP